MQKIRFWLTKAYVHVLVLARKLTGNPWMPVQGIQLPVSPEIGFNTLRWIIDGTYEVGEFRLVEKHLNSTDRVLEIGTGLGFMSAYCAKRIGSTQVYSFEANPYNLETAKRVYAKNQVQPHLRLALLADKAGMVSFPVDRKSRLASSALVTQMETVEVEQLDINAVIHEIAPTFLIMDIEGAEFDLLPLIQFQTIRKIQAEFHPHLLGQSKVDQLIQWLATNGFRLVEQLPDGRNFYFERG